MASFFIGANLEEDGVNGNRPVVDIKQFRPSRNSENDEQIKSHRINDRPLGPTTHSGKPRPPSSPVMPDSNKTEEVTESSALTTPLEGNAERLIELLFCDSPNGETKQLFCELEELVDGVWCESARWVRFEEDVEIGGDRWSKPFVAALSLHSVFDLRHQLLNCVLLLDTEVQSFCQLINVIADNMVEHKLIEADVRERVTNTLMLRHIHQHEHSGALLKRGLSEIGKKISAWRVDEHEPIDIVTDQSRDPGTVVSTERNDLDVPFKQNESFAKKLAPGSEASTSLVGGVDFLKQPVSAFVRLSSKITLSECSEVSVPTRFIFILLGPSSKSKDLREVGRVMETIMSDDIFRDVAYRGSTRADLLAGLDEFLDEAIALPPSEWDPKIRIEPPMRIPSTEARKFNVLTSMSSEKSLTLSDVPSKNRIASRGLSEVSMKVEPADKDDKQPPPSASEAHASMAAFMDDLLKKQTEDDDKKAVHELDPALMRTGRIFGGLIADVKRKGPWYASDITDACNMQCVASVFFLFFACLAPIVTFGGLLGVATDNNIAAFESILTGAVCGTTYHLFSGQPLTIIGSTGPVLLFEKILFGFSKDFALDYLALRFWIGVWAAVFLMLIVAFDLNALVALITRFTEECFATLISVIFIFEAFVAIYGIYKTNPISSQATMARNYSCWCEWVRSNYSYMYAINPDEVNSLKAADGSSYNSTLFDCRMLDVNKCSQMSPCRKVGPGCDLRPPVPDVFFFSCLLFFGTCALSFALRGFRTSPFFPAIVRRCVSDFSVSISIVMMVAIDFFVSLPTPKLQVPEEFAPTRHGRGWVVEPLSNPVWTIAVAPFPAILLAVLLFMDQQITAVIVNRREHKLLKGKGYHLDLFVLTTHVLFCATFGLPYFVAATVLSITHVNSLRKQSETSAPGEQPRFLGLIEQRVTGFAVFALIGCAVPLRGALKFIPMPVLYGVFLFMGLSALKTSQFYSRCLLFFMPEKYQPDAPYLRHMRTWRVHLFTLIQLTAFIFLWLVKQIKEISILFILMLLVMVILRKLLDYVFTQDELKWVDDILPKNPLAICPKPESEQKETQQEESAGRQPAVEEDKQPKRRNWLRLGRGNQAENPPMRDRMLHPPPAIVVVSPSREPSMSEQGQLTTISQH